MKKRLYGLVASVVMAAATIGCTQQTRAKNFGGTATEQLPRGSKLVNATWKEDNLWLLTRDMTAEDSPETYVFRESSSLGILQGRVIIQETR